MKGLVVALGALCLLALGLIGTASASDRPGADSAWKARPGAVLGSPTPSPTCLPSWTVVSTTTVSLGDAELRGITAISADDVWAVGVYYTETHSIENPRYPRPLPSLPGQPGREGPEGGSIERTLIYHWDGVSWSVVPSPNP